MPDRSVQVVFRRVRGRLVPIKIKRQGPDYGNPDAVKTGIAAGTAAAGTVGAFMKAKQYGAFKQATRLSDIATHYGRMPHPTLEATRVIKGNGFKMLQPDMFQRLRYDKQVGVWKAMQAKAVKFGTLAAEKLTLSRAFRKWALPAAVGVGVVAGAGAYLSHIAIDRTKKK